MGIIEFIIDLWLIVIFGGPIYMLIEKLLEHKNSGWFILMIVSGFFPLISLCRGEFLQDINNSGGVFFLSVLSVYSMYKIVYNILEGNK